MGAKLWLFWRYANALSIDVALGAVGSFEMAQHVWQINLPFCYDVLLFVCVFGVYGLDHLFDSADLQAESINFRHEFFRKNFAILRNTLLLSLLLAGGAAIYAFPVSVILMGLVLVLVSGIYFLALKIAKVRGFFVPKEPIIAIVYVAGTVGIVATVAHQTIHLVQIVFTFFYVVLVLAEGTLAAWFDREIDRKQGHPSLALWLGQKYSKLFLHGLMLLLGTILVLSTSLFSRPERMVMSGSVLVLWTILLFPEVFEHSELYRILGEFVFLLPLLLEFV